MQSRLFAASGITVKYTSLTSAILAAVGVLSASSIGCMANTTTPESSETSQSSALGSRSEVLPSGQQFTAMVLEGGDIGSIMVGTFGSQKVEALCAIPDSPKRSRVALRDQSRGDKRMKAFTFLKTASADNEYVLQMSLHAPQVGFFQGDPDTGGNEVYSIFLGNDKFVSATIYWEKGKITSIVVPSDDTVLSFSSCQ